MRTRINCKNTEEFLQVAAFYNWTRFIKEEIRDWKKAYTIYLDDIKGPNGWDRTDYAKMHSYDIKGDMTFEEWAKANNQLKIENKMKYVVEVNNQDELNTVRVYAGISKYMQNDVKYPWTVNGLTGLMSSPDYYKARAKEYGPVLAFKDWALMFGVELKPNKTLKLTNDYSAVVNYSDEVVQVGCQTIPFKTVETLAKLIKE